MNDPRDPLWLALTIGLVPPLFGCVLLAVAYYAFLKWVNRRASADRFADEFIPEVADVAAIEASLPDMRDTWIKP